MTTQQNKIILVTYENGKIEYFSYTLEHMERVIKAMQLRVAKISQVQIIEHGKHI